MARPDVIVLPVPLHKRKEKCLRTMSPLILHGRLEADGRALTHADAWAHELLARWEAARQQLARLDSGLIPQQHPLRVLVEEDFPRIMKRLKVSTRSDMRHGC